MPDFAAWRFVDGVDGFEVVYPGGGTLRGHTSAVEQGRPYAVGYEIQLDQRWNTRRARVWADTLDRTGEIVLASDGDGTWTLDGVPAPHLNGLIEVVAPAGDPEAPAGEAAERDCKCQRRARREFAALVDIAIREFDRVLR